MGSMHEIPPTRYGAFDANDPGWALGQSSRHLNLCILLRELLLRAVTANDTVGMDAFTFFDEHDDRKKCAPDAFVKLGVKRAAFPSWATWTDGAPELCVEILSPSDTKEFLTQEEKLARFETMGVREVVFFDVDAPVGQRLRVWDRVDGKLARREVSNERAECRTLKLWFHVAPLADEPVALVLAANEAGDGRILTNAEARFVAEEGRRVFEAKWIEEREARQRAEHERARAEHERANAEARIAELEAQLRAKGTRE